MPPFSHTTPGTRRLRHLWRTVFVCFLLLNFGCAEADTLRAAATALLPAAARWPSPVLALPPVAALVGLHLLVERRAPFPPALYVLTLAPSIALAATLPTLFTAPGWSLAVTALLLGLWTLLWRHHARRSSTFRSQIPVLTQMQTNATLLFAMLLYAGLAGQHDRAFHHQLRAWQAIEDGDYGRALSVGRHDCRVPRTLFALRTYAAAHMPDGLGGHLFALPLPDSLTSASLLPDGEGLPADSLRRRLMREMPQAYAQSEEASPASARTDSLSPLAADYHLAACLLDKQIDSFATAYLHLRPHPSAARPPLYYAEALLLYSRLRTSPVLVYTDPACQANYHDFTTLRRPQTDETPALRASRLRLTYGDTYWWYFYCH